MCIYIYIHACVRACVRACVCVCDIYISQKIKLMTIKVSMLRSVKFLFFKFLEMQSRLKITD